MCLLALTSSVSTQAKQLPDVVPSVFDGLVMNYWFCCLAETSKFPPKIPVLILLKDAILWLPHCDVERSFFACRSAWTKLISLDCVRRITEDFSVTIKPPCTEVCFEVTVSQRSSDVKSIYERFRRNLEHCIVLHLEADLKWQMACLMHGLSHLRKAEQCVCHTNCSHFLHGCISNRKLGLVDRSLFYILTDP